MKYLTLDHIRQQLRIEQYAEEDAVLDLYGGAAEDTILNLINRSIDNVIETYGGVPDPIRQATLLLVGISYQHREPASAQSISIIPYTLDILIKPYMRLASAQGETCRVQTAILGSDVKIEFTADLPDGLTMQEVDFTAIVYNETAIDRKKQYAKSECILTDEGSYVVLVDTEDLGVGQLMLRVVFQIPDTDYPSGYRKEVVKINPYTRIIG